MQSPMLPGAREAVVVKLETISAPPMGICGAETRANVSSMAHTSASALPQNVRKTGFTMQELFLLGRGQICASMLTTSALERQPDAVRVFSPQPVNQRIASSTRHIQETQQHLSHSESSIAATHSTNSDATSSSNQDSPWETRITFPPRSNESMLVRIPEVEESTVTFHDWEASTSHVFEHSSNAESAEPDQRSSIPSTEQGHSAYNDIDVPLKRYPGYAWVKGPTPPSKIVDVVAILPRCTRSGRQF
jgi:hypothetical protein